MKNTFLSRFTPSSMTAETLEAIFVQRHELVKDLIEVIRDSVLTKNKHFRLLVGGRGMGKTHTVSLIYHRLSAMDDLKDKLVIAWMREEEWGVASFLDLLLRIFRALEQEYPEEYKAKLAQEIQSLYQMSPDVAEHKAGQLLREFVGEKSSYGDRTLLLLMENLDNTFSGLGDIGQKQFRAYIQNYSFITILATSQRLFNGIKQKDAAFYGFFYPQYLEQLELDEVVDLLERIAKVQGDKELEDFIKSPTGRDRIKAIHYLAGGNHRVYVIFAEFLTRKSLDELVEPFMQTLDELTPYYQARMQWLSPQQRKIVDFLCDRRHAVTVKEIAQYCFITHQTASSQLKDLLNKGYVKVEAIGRESFYELQEILMRFCLDVKKQRGKPISLIVDFLRCWYTKEELKQRLNVLNAKFQGITFDSIAVKASDSMLISQTDRSYVLEREYISLALQKQEEKGKDPRVAACWQEYENCHKKAKSSQDIENALSYLEKIALIDRDNSLVWILRGNCLNNLGRYEEAVASYDRALEINPDRCEVWLLRGVALSDLGRYEEAINSYDRALEINPKYDSAWNNRGIDLHNLGRYEEAITSYDRTIKVNPDDYSAWYNRGNALSKLERYEEAIASYNRAIEVNPDDYSAWYNRGISLDELGRYEEAIASYNRALEINPDNDLAWYFRGGAFRKLGKYEEAVASYDRAIEVNPDDDSAWHNRGNALYKLGRYEEAINSYDRALEINPDNDLTWCFRAIALRGLGRYEEAITSYDRAIEIESEQGLIWLDRGNILSNLGRYEEAIKSYDRTLKINSKNDLVWFIRGIALDKLGMLEEAIASYNRVIEINPEDDSAWYEHGITLGKLGRLEESVVSLERALEINYDKYYAWNSHAWALIQLELYNKALEACDRSIELGEKDCSVFFNRSISLLALNRWDEGIISLKDSLDRLTDGEKPASEDIEIIIRNLFNQKQDRDVWKSRIEILLKIFDRYKVTSILGQGIVKTIPTLMSEMVSDKAAQTWLKTWQELTGDRPEFQIPLRLLNTAVRYKQKKGDRRIVLELAIEERELLQPLLEREKS